VCALWQVPLEEVLDRAEGDAPPPRARNKVKMRVKGPAKPVSTVDEGDED
jgi:hypothetical protein